jgi:hypothetical protein
MHALTQQSEPNPIDPPVCTEEEIRANSRWFVVARAAWSILAVLLGFGGLVVGSQTSYGGVGLGFFVAGVVLGFVCYLNYSDGVNAWVMLEPQDCTTLLKLSERVPDGEAYIKAVRAQGRPFIQFDLLNMLCSASMWERWEEGTEDRANYRRLYGLDDGAADDATKGTPAAEGEADTSSAAAI